MDVTCGSCQSKFKVPDEKVPKGQVFSVPCPKCKNKISIDTRPKEASRAPEPEPQKEKNLADEVASWAYDSAEKPFDFVEEGMQTALLWAALRGHHEVVKVLIEHRADVNAQDSNGWTPLRWAESKGHTQTVALLQEAGAK